MLESFIKLPYLTTYDSHFYMHAINMYFATYLAVVLVGHKLHRAISELRSLQHISPAPSVIQMTEILRGNYNMYQHSKTLARH